jgi:hypothetical protein
MSAARLPLGEAEGSEASQRAEKCPTRASPLVAAEKCRALSLFVSADVQQEN